MAYEVVWSPRAVDDVRAIASHIAEDSIAYAKSVAQKIVASTRKLANFPMSGRVVIYRVEGGTVTIAAVVHGKRPVELEVRP